MTYHTQLGQLELYLLSDGLVHVDAGGPFGLVPQPLYAQFYPPDEANRIPMTLHCLLVRAQDTLILVDTGIGTKLSHKIRDQWRLERPDGDLLQGLARLGIKPEDVDIVINSHLHSDHCGGNTCLEAGQVVPRFPEATYWVQRIEWAEACHPNARTRNTYHASNFEPLFDNGQLRLLHGDTQVVEGVRCVVAPGHTVGHQCVLLESDGQKALFVADMATYAVQMARTAWVTAYDIDPQENILSKNHWQQWALEQDALLLFQHDPFTPVGRLRAENGRFRIERVRLDQAG